MPKLTCRRKLTLSLAVAAAIATQNVTAQASTTAIEGQIEETFVTGIRQSLLRAMDLKQNAPSIQDSIVAEDIGKFPDQNIAESMQRITGVAISRENGEGSKLTVRGFGPKFNLVQLNGRTLATVDRGREFDFQVLPAELIAGVDIVKAARANVPEGSIGAYVNTKTARPLEHPGLHAVGAIQTTYQSLAEQFDPRLSFSVSNTFLDDTLGVSLAAATVDSTQRTDSFETAVWALQSVQGQPGPFKYANGASLDNTDKVWYPGRLRFSVGVEERERTSGNLTLQWAPTDNFTSTFDAFYTSLENTEFTDGLQIPLQITGWSDVLVSDNLTALKAHKDKTKIDGLFRLVGGDAKTTAFGLNSVYEGDSWKLKGDISYSKAADNPFQNDFSPQFVNQSAGATTGWALSGVDFADFDSTTGDIPTVTTSYDFTDASTIRSHFNNLLSQKLSDEVTEARLDLIKTVEFGMLESVEAGVSYSDRTKAQDEFGIVSFCADPKFLPSNSPEFMARTVCDAAKDHSDNLFEVRNNDFLSGVSGNFPREFVSIPDYQAYLEEIGRLRQEPTWADQVYKPAAAVNNTEETKAIYVQTNLAGETRFANWSGNFGLRYVETETTSQGFRQELVNVVPNYPEGNTGSNGWPVTSTLTPPVERFAAKSYDNLLPSLNLSLDLDNGNYIKTAAAQVMTRPAIEDIGVNRTANYNRAEFFSSTRGNPLLNPYKADQFDLSFEHYSINGNAYSVNYFYKKISDFIATSRSVVDLGIALPGYSDNNGTLTELVTQKTNLDGGTVQGAEIAGLHYFDYLPSFWSGFGASANYTYIDTSDGAVDTAVAIPGATTPKESLEGFSQDSFNIGLFYDRDGLQARVAYNWRSDFLKSLSGASSRGQLSEHVESYGQVDLSASYDISDNITLTGEVINLTNEKLLEYADIRERVTLVDYNGVRYQLGVRAKF
ncbi:TonB-dependent receptor [Pedobacter sp.]|uniref:TonB-dependent receptor n=1 Tax=Pedobacter sp. TaxID=1411316 RepID=UPI003C61A758